ncbi:MAG: hypothetical protein KY447_12165 [Actinobacteria bacterium]|nr:hypothetical protein [Actinomycetota bacterium]
MVVVYLEADDIAAAFMTGTSDEPFDRWFRDHVRDVHDVDMAEDFLLPEQIPDFRAEPAS